MKKSKREAHLKQWEVSGQTKKAYCETVGIKYGTFISWFSAKKQNKRSVSAGKFIELKGSRQPEMEISFPNGVRMFLNQPVSVELIKMLADV